MKKEKTGLASIDKPWLEQYDPQDKSIITDFQGKTIWDVTEKKLFEYWDVPLVEYFNNVISRETFYEYVIQWAKTLKALDVQEGDLVPLYIPCIPESYALFFAVNAIGATPYYLKMDIAKEALERETQEAKVAIVFDGLWENVKEVFNDNRFKNIVVTSAADSMMFPMKQVLKMKDYFERRSNKNAIPKSGKFIWASDAKKIADYYTGEYKADYNPNHIAAITASSGTTSHNVKGIMDTNDGILEALRCALISEPGMGKGTRLFTCFPLLASTSLNCEHLIPTYTGGTIIMDPRADAELWYPQLMKSKPAAALTTGPVWEMFTHNIIKNEKEKGIKHDLSWADYFILGAAATTPETLEWMNSVMLSRGAKREIKVGYGMSEAFGVLAVNRYREDKDKDSIQNLNKEVNSVGIPLREYTIGIFDENGKELPYGKGLRGELWFKTPANMHGYYNQPDLTENTIVDGWIHSGDLCEIDEFGNIYVYGRVQNSITIADKKTYIFDIANDLRKTFDLHDSLVEKKKLSDGGNALNLYFVQKEDKTVDGVELIKQMDNYLAEKGININGYKEHVTSLPIDPATIKHRTKDIDGFKKYIDNQEYDVSYEEVSMDVYEEKMEKVLAKQKVK